MPDNSEEALCTPCCRIRLMVTLPASLVYSNNEHFSLAQIKNLSVCAHLVEFVWYGPVGALSPNSYRFHVPAALKKSMSPGNYYITEQFILSRSVYKFSHVLNRSFRKCHLMKSQIRVSVLSPWLRKVSIYSTVITETMRILVHSQDNAGFSVVAR